MIHKMPTAESFPGIRDYWLAVTDVLCPSCKFGIIRRYEAGHVSEYRRCDTCGQEFLAGGTVDYPTLEQKN